MIRPVRALAPLILLLSLTLPRPALAQLQCGTATLADDGWSFALRDDSAFAQPGFDDRAWQRVDLPHDWSVHAPMRRDLASCTGYLPGGIGWYRKKLTATPAPADGRLYLYFEGVYNRSEVYLNGHLLGKRPNGTVSFYYDATPYWQADGDNVVAVRVDHSRYADSRWYTGSGIYRHVWLVRTGPVHLAPWGVFVRAEEIGPTVARLRISAEIQNDSDKEERLLLRQEVLTAAHSVVATSEQLVIVPAHQSTTSEHLVSVAQPQLWSVNDPRLYTVRTSVLAGGKSLDATITRTGIRHFGFDANRGFLLNGQPMKLKGVCLHHDAGVLGAAVPREVWRQRLQTLKGVGCNAIRLSHNPQAPDVYELCDELGLVVLDEFFDEWEFPKRKWLQGWNVGVPGFEGSFDFFNEWSARDIADTVRRDRNHPSVFAWSIGNEIDYPNDPYSHPVLDRARINQPTLPGYLHDHPDASRMGDIAQRLAAEVKKYDPSRPVTAALAGVVMSNETAYPAALDIVGYNYTEDRYAADHARYPERVIYGSENGHSFGAWRAVRDTPFIFGQFLWTGIDYLGEAGAWPSRGSSAGLLDLTGAIKPRGRFREALWSERPVIYLGVEPRPEKNRSSIDADPRWNFEPGESVRVYCYTNAPTVRLVLNGRQFQTEKPLDDSSGMIWWDVPFAAGTLEAVGLDRNGQVSCRTKLATAHTGVGFQTFTRTPKIATAHGVAVVSVQIVDDQGAPVVTADRAVTCTIAGPGRLLGLESGDLADVAPAPADARRTHGGHLVAYVEATGAPGFIQVKFAGSDLDAAVLALEAR